MKELAVLTECFNDAAIVAIVGDVASRAARHQDFDPGPGVLFQHPILSARIVSQMLRYFTSRNAPREILQSLVRGQVHTLGVGMHNFMDAKQVAQADSDPVIKARLDSCVFKGAVKRNGEWEAVPMCSMNQQTWAEVYDTRMEDPELLKQPQVYAPAETEL